MTLPRESGTGKIVKDRLIILTGTLGNQMTKATMKIVYIYSPHIINTGMIFFVAINKITFVKQGMYLLLIKLMLSPSPPPGICDLSDFGYPVEV